MLFYETNHRKERNDGKDTTDTDFSVPAASAEKAEDFCYYTLGFSEEINNFILMFQAPLFSTINADRGAFVPLQKGGFI